MDQDLAPGLTPGHLGAPVHEPEPEPLPCERSSGERSPGSEPPEPPSGRTGLACGITALLLSLLAGSTVLVGLQYFGSFDSSPAADYTGGGTGAVQISVPKGASLTKIGQILVQNQVVASVKAFTTAASLSSGQRILPGTYPLKHEMSAAAALNVLDNPFNANGLTVPEGWRASQIYAAIDQRLRLPAGTAQRTAQEHQGDLGLPDFAGGNLEGLLFPATYGVTSETSALALLQQMVKQAGTEFNGEGLTGEASALGITPYQALVVASLVQGEADNRDDMAKVARVIYNRLGRKMPLQLDSTINYALGRTTLHTTVTDTNLNSPFNTYQHSGLPPTPIDNPGHDALDAALNPAPGDWLYFVTVSPGDTRFTDSEQQHRKNVADFNAYQAQHPSEPSPSTG
ncbi:endolytic transglycosylase MltG [Kitasatospora sp. NPDC052896]|uniref:endolytic transglycosylase MltG n=1 Tax=Kitasatospora sp. NPDC052896 TaxID=3364061 RepID=UPI0037C87EA0